MNPLSRRLHVFAVFLFIKFLYLFMHVFIYGFMHLCIYFEATRTVPGKQDRQFGSLEKLISDIV